jgi:cyclophilin family peptidyl-prolyl cis-trans isomerase
LQAPALIPADAPVLSRIASSQIVQAKDRASASGSRVNKDPDSLLRLGLPKQNKEMREMQAGLEECEDNLKRTLSIQAKGGLDKSERILAGNVDKFLSTLNSGDTEKGKELLRALKDSVALVRANLDRNPDEALVDNRKALDTISRFQELTALTYTQPDPPKDLRSTLPYLKGRGEVDFVITRPGGEFNVNRKAYAKIELTMTLDGYTAPVTAGNLMDLVNKGFYNGMTIQRSDGFVVQTGDPGAEKGKNKDIHGYVPAGKQKVRNVPLEIYVAGDKEPIYGATLDEDGRGGYATALPFNAYGALGMAREEYNVESASSQFFWLLFDSDLTPAGKNMLDGTYTCFGYTTRNAELLADVKEGDVIESAKVRSGLQNLVQPA